ncbi:MAG TPA: hypothetical protein DEP17_04210 [Lachnospiraceae bacterium]|jgi:hypothetical protein|nr:hypothetical protein [Lachnospiraceae bacterium]
MHRNYVLAILIFCLMILCVACTDTETVKPEALKQYESDKNETVELTQVSLIQNDFIVYFVNCAAGKVTEADAGDIMGLYQSVTDQRYGEDSGTGMLWGYQEKSYMAADGDLNSLNKLDTKWVIKEGTDIIPEETGFYYDFSVPPGEYEVICGFYDPFSARPVSVRAEDEQVIVDQKILKYKLTQTSFLQQVSDGVLNLLIYNPSSGDEVMKDPVLSYIIIRAVPDYDEGLLSNLIDTASFDDTELEEYTTASKERYQTAYREAKITLRKADPSRQDYKNSYLKLKEVYDTMIKKPYYTTFRPGQVWKDTEDNLIQAHGGQVQRLTVKEKHTGKMVEKWWWVGEDKTQGCRGGICAYSSDDLYNWTFEGVVMRNVSSRKQLEEEEYFKKLYADYTSEQLDKVYTCINDSTSIIERPKMIYCKETGQYVIWFHADGPTKSNHSNYAAASAGVAVSDTPYGPFRFINRYRLNTCPEDQEDKYPKSKGMARDMNLFVDDDGTAYIIYSSEENLTLYISKLNFSYTYLAADPKEAVYGVDFIRIFPGAQREAPAVFKRNGKYYMMTSGCTGWAPNPAKMFMSDSMLGTWVDKGDPCIDDTKRTTFDSQSTCIFLADEEKKIYVYMGDRWNNENLADSRYLWLPLNFDEEGNASLTYTNEWKLP